MWDERDSVSDTGECADVIAQLAQTGGSMRLGARLRLEGVASLAQAIS